MAIESIDYNFAQREIRQYLILSLKRNNGLITLEEYDQLFSSSKIGKRLLKQHVNGGFEWKLDIVTKEDLAKKIGINVNKVNKEILICFDNSKDISKRSKYPHLAPSRKTTQYKKDYLYTFGFDILIRKPTKFNNVNPVNNFYISDKAFAVFLHVDKHEFMIRANMGAS